MEFCTVLTAGQGGLCAEQVAELICGKAFASRKREEFVIATKVGSPLPVNGGTLSLAPEHILSECDGSRERLGVDQIDIYYAHWPDGNGVPVEASCGAFAQLVREGKIKHWAISNHSVAQTKEVLAICDAKGWPRPVMHQPPFSLLKPDHARDLLPYRLYSITVLATDERCIEILYVSTPSKC